MKRRDAIKLGAVAATIPLLPRELAFAAEAAPTAAKFFSAPEMALLDALTEAIIPADEHSGGARAAKVAAYIDGRLAEYDPTIPDLRDERDKWKAGLAAVDAASVAANGKSYLEATPEQQLAVLTAMAGGEKDPKTDAQKFFKPLKQWTARGYYTSSVGIHDEMEYKGNVMQETYAGIDVATLPKVEPKQ